MDGGHWVGVLEESKNKTIVLLLLSVYSHSIFFWPHHHLASYFIFTLFNSESAVFTVSFVSFCFNELTPTVTFRSQLITEARLPSQPTSSFYTRTPTELAYSHSSLFCDLFHFIWFFFVFVCIWRVLLRLFCIPSFVVASVQSHHTKHTVRYFIITQIKVSWKKGRCSNRLWPVTVSQSGSIKPCWPDNHRTYKPTNSTPWWISLFLALWRVLLAAVLVVCSSLWLFVIDLRQLLVTVELNNFKSEKEKERKASKVYRQKAQSSRLNSIDRKGKERNRIRYHDTIG